MSSKSDTIDAEIDELLKMRDWLIQNLPKQPWGIDEEQQAKNLNENTLAIKALILREREQAKYGIVLNALNLLNTEPIHTVEQALLRDMERLETEISRLSEEESHE